MNESNEASAAVATEAKGPAQGRADAGWSLKEVASLGIAVIAIVLVGFRTYQSFQPKVKHDPSSLARTDLQRQVPSTEQQRQIHSIDEWEQILPYKSKDAVVAMLGKPDSFQQKDAAGGVVAWERFTYYRVVDSKYSNRPDDLNIDFHFDRARSLEMGSGRVIQLF